MPVENTYTDRSHQPRFYCFGVDRPLLTRYQALDEGPNVVESHNRAPPSHLRVTTVRPHFKGPAGSSKKDRAGMVVVSPDLSKGMPTHKFPEFSVVAFPEPWHFPLFKGEGERMSPYGPSFYNPGAVGTLTFEWRPNKGAEPWKMGVAQSHFSFPRRKQKRREAVPSRSFPLPAGNLPRETAEMYRHWWDHALEEAFSLAKLSGRGIVVENRYLAKREALQKAIERVCRRWDIGPVRRSNLTRLDPRQSAVKPRRTRRRK